MGSREFHILQAKLTCPDPAVSLFRPRLSALHRAVLRHRLTLVTAGAGYGKTAFAAQALAGLDLASVWYRLDRTDQDRTAFIHYILKGINLNFPEFAGCRNGVIQMLEDHSVRSRSLAMQICSGLESLASCRPGRVPDPMVWVLDDFHRVDPSRPITRILTVFLAYLPDWVHLILVSRKPPSLSLSRYWADRAVLEITETELGFDREETLGLAKEGFHISLSGAQVDRLQEKTRGWAAGLVLFFSAVKNGGRSDPAALLDRLTGSMDQVRSFLEENVYAGLPREIRDFLIRTSLLDEVDPALADHLLGIGHSRDILDRLVKDHLFVFRTEPNRLIFIYHGIWRQFLLATLEQTLGRDAVAGLHEKTAQALESRNEPEKAMAHYFKAGCLDRASSLFARVGMEMAYQGRGHQLKTCLEKLPGPMVEKDPRLLFIQGTQAGMTGRFKAAAAGYQKALELFESLGEGPGVSRCLTKLALLYYVKGDFQASGKTYARLIRDMPGTPGEQTECLGYLVFMAAYCGNLKKADRYYRRGISLLDDTGENPLATGLLSHLEVNFGFRHFFEGNMAQALSLYRDARDRMAGLPWDKLRIINWHLAASVLLRTGDIDGGMRRIRKGVDLARRLGYRDGSLAFPLLGRSRLCQARGKWDRAMALARESLAAFVRMNSLLGQASAWMEIGACHLGQGRFSMAGETAEKGLNLIRGLDLPLIRSELWILKARAALDAGEPARALAALDRAGTQVSFARFHDCQICLLRVRALADAHGKPRENRTLVRTLECILREGYHQLLRDARPWLSSHLSSLAGPLGRAPWVLRTLSLIRGYAPPIRARLFDRFQLYVGERQVRTRDWKSVKSLTLLKYLLYVHPKGFINKELLMELLWPGADPRKSAKRFHVALASLRKTLEPGIAKGERSAYIESVKDGYRMDIKAQGCIDTVRFSRLVSRAETCSEGRLETLLSAAALYRGNFLDKERFQEWVVTPRQRFRDAFLDLVKEIISLYTAGQDYEASIRYARMYLKYEDCAEEIYQELIRLHALTGNRAACARTYEACRTALAEKLDCAPSRTTRDLYLRAVGKGPMVKN